MEREAGSRLHQTLEVPQSRVQGSPLWSSCCRYVCSRPGVGYTVYFVSEQAQNVPRTGNTSSRYGGYSCLIWKKFKWWCINNTSTNRSSILRGSEENECPYFESDAPEILHKLLEKGLIELPKSNRPEEVGRTNDPKYCKYHRIISHQRSATHSGCKSCNLQRKEKSYLTKKKLKNLINHLWSSQCFIKNGHWGQTFRSPSKTPKFPNPRLSSHQK